jgi:DNA-binding GntR family transcriptional regulator
MSSSLTAASGAPPSRTAAALDAIKHAILAGELRPGQPLVEAELAGLLGFSKTPVREALKTLAGSGLVTISPYKGAAVRVIDDAAARHIYDVRRLLEPEALARAVAAGAGWEAAEGALGRAGAAGDEAARSLATRDFHRALYAGSGNPLLTTILDELRDQAALVSAAAWRRDPPSWARESAEHRAILAAALAGDPQGAAGLLRAHIDSFAERNFAD